MSIKNALFLHLSRKKSKVEKSTASKAIAQQALEPRLLLDAAAVSTLAEASGDVANDDNLNSAIQQLGPPRLSEWDQWIAQYDSEEATVAEDENYEEIYIIDESVVPVLMQYIFSLMAVILRLSLAVQFSPRKTLTNTKRSWEPGQTDSLTAQIFCSTDAK